MQYFLLLLQEIANENIQSVDSKPSKIEIEQMKAKGVLLSAFIHKNKLEGIDLDTIIQKELI